MGAYLSTVTGLFKFSTAKVSLRTVYRDIKSIKMIGFIIVITVNYWILLYTTPNIKLSRVVLAIFE